MNLTKVFQEKGVRDLLSESWSVSAPMTLIMVFEFLIGITDIYVAGKIGKERLAKAGFDIDPNFSYPISEPTFVEPVLTGVLPSSTTATLE